jgi:hypothetical protein
VKLSLDDVMDYIYEFPDRTFLGNETGRVTAPEEYQATDGGRWRQVGDD